MSVRLTEQQRAASTGTGNLLVVAGAGTGKTATLVARCLHFLVDADEPLGIDQILMVTFTEAAAAEMRHRLRVALEARLGDDAVRDRVREQLALLDTASIGTLHGFCLRLIREHFHMLGLDPRVQVLPAGEAAALEAEVLAELLRRDLESHQAPGPELRRWIGELLQRGDAEAREWILAVHGFVRSLADPVGWLEREYDRWSAETPPDWSRWLETALTQWSGDWEAHLDHEPEENPRRAPALECLRRLRSATGLSGQAPLLLELVGLLSENWARGTARFKPALEPVKEEAQFLATLLPAGEGVEPLSEDWDRARPSMLTLLVQVGRFQSAYQERKREMACLDFSDLEQYALELLWDRAAGEPTQLGRQLRGRMGLIMVDEFQDISPAQDFLLCALGRDAGEGGNRFLVGDVKQSIYRFRRADPGIFLQYLKDWNQPEGRGRVQPLTGNFRSRPALIQLGNDLFETLFSPRLGGVLYDGTQRLAPGDASAGDPLDSAPALELHLVEKRRPSGAGESEAGVEGDEEGMDWSQVEREALTIGHRLRELKDSGALVRDPAEPGGLKKVGWSDMAILLRAVRSRATAFDLVFRRLKIPLQVARPGFFDEIEVSDLINLLAILDNPLQDVPLLAVLRSPLVGLSLEDLAGVRQVRPAGAFWLALTALEREADPDGVSEEGLRRIRRFREVHRRWRQLGRESSLAARLEGLLEETFWLEWLAGRPGGAAAVNNVRQFLRMAREFDLYQQRSLHRFLIHLENRREQQEEPDPPPPPGGEAVTLMTVHKSKGLEFPVVVVADLSRRFSSMQDRGSLQLDPELGLCPKLRRPGTRTLYPSLPHWLFLRQERLDGVSEELRLFYVAFTRARDRLLLVGTLPPKPEKADKPDKLAQWAEKSPTRQARPGSGHLLEWMVGWMTLWTGRPDWMHQADGGQHGAVNWSIHPDPDGGTGESASEPASEPDPEASMPKTLPDRLAWVYPFGETTGHPAKWSVTGLRRLAEAEAESHRPFRPRLRMERPSSGMSPAEVGIAHHTFLQWAEPSRALEVGGVSREAARLRSAGHLSAAEVEALDLEGLASFWSSELGERIRAVDPKSLFRELPFTLKLDRDTAQQARLPDSQLPEDGDFLVVQGTVDLAWFGPDGIEVVDFKTDQIPLDELEWVTARYAPQLLLYGVALEALYGQSVVKRWLHFLHLRRTQRVD